MKPYLNSFSEGLAETLGSKLVSIVAYGAAVREAGGVPSLMVVVESVDPGLLGQIGERLTQARKQGPLALMILTEAELAQSTDVFPIKFLGIQRLHKILHGKDVVDGLKVQTTHLRLRCEQELKNLALRLRQQYLQRAQFVDSLMTTLVGARVVLLDNLGILAELKDKGVPETNEVLRLAEEWGLETDVLMEVQALASGSTSAPELPAIQSLYGRFMKFTDQAALLADQL